MVFGKKIPVSFVQGAGQPNRHSDLNFDTGLDRDDKKVVPIPGYTMADCDEIYRDCVAWPVSWKGRSDLSALAGKPLRVRFSLQDADVYAMQFRAI